MIRLIVEDGESAIAADQGPGKGEELGQRVDIFAIDSVYIAFVEGFQLTRYFGCTRQLTIFRRSNVPPQLGNNRDRGTYCIYLRLGPPTVMSYTYYKFPVDRAAP